MTVSILLETPVMTTISTKSARRPAPNVPHSWELGRWETNAADVWPHDQKRAAWVVRAYRSELVEHGALTRIGKTLVILGAGYTRWLEQRSHHVAEFTSNNPGLKRTNI